MRDYLTIMEGDLVPTTGPHTGDLAHDYADNLTVGQARAMLDGYPEGFLGHAMLENEAFVCVTRQGMYLFYDPASDQMQHWDWELDIKRLHEHYVDDHSYNPLSDWAYLPAADEMPMTSGGMRWWDRIRDGLEVPVS